VEEALRGLVSKSPAGRLFSRLVKTGALLAERLAAISLPNVFLLYVVTCIAVGVVVMNGLLD
jgi:hypothetical protein